MEGWMDGWLESPGCSGTDRGMTREHFSEVTFKQRSEERVG